MRFRLLSLCIPIPLLPWNNCHHVLRRPRSSQVYLYMYRDCDPSGPTQTDYVLSISCVDVIGVVTMLSNVSSLRIRTRQSESLKRTVTICNARSDAHKCLHAMFVAYYVCIMSYYVYGCLSYRLCLTVVLHWMLCFGVRGQLHSQLNKSIGMEPPHRP